MKLLYKIILAFVFTSQCIANSNTFTLSANAIDIRTVIQQIAELTDRNIILSDEVQGEISLHLKDVSWQIALDSLLEAKQLQAIDKGGVILITSRTKEIPLPPVLINEKPIKKKCIKKMSLQQVLIEARIVNIQNNLSKELGIKWGIHNAADSNNWQRGVQVNLPIQNPYASQASFSLIKLPQNLYLDLELTALESEHLVEEIANPRLITLNQQQALIRQGDEIPYQETSANGATSVSFRDAVLELRVTPTITNGNKVLLAIALKNDSRSAESLAGNIPVISTKEMATQVMLADGETVMLGGIYSQDKNDKIQKVPWLGQLPFLGSLFRSESKHISHKEMLIFVTPKILNEPIIKRSKQECESYLEG